MEVVEAAMEIARIAANAVDVRVKQKSKRNNQKRDGYFPSLYAFDMMFQNRP